MSLTKFFPLKMATVPQSLQCVPKFLLHQVQWGIERHKIVFLWEIFQNHRAVCTWDSSKTIAKHQWECRDYHGKMSSHLKSIHVPTSNIVVYSATKDIHRIANNSSRMKYTSRWYLWITFWYNIWPHLRIQIIAKPATKRFVRQCQYYV